MRISYSAHTPFPLTNIPQPKFEAALFRAIEAEPLVSFERGVACTALEERGDGVVATLARMGEDETVDVECSYVVAADGAGSRLREALGIAMEGPDALQHYIMIHFEADLRALTAARPGVLYFLFDPATSGVLIAYDRAKTWVLMHPCDPAADAPESFDEAKCRPLVEAAIADAAPVAAASSSATTPPSGSGRRSLVASRGTSTTGAGVPSGLALIHISSPSAPD